MHLEELMKDIRQRHVLGVPVAYIYVIEYQKRGLPHAHLLLRLAEGSKLREPAVLTHSSVHRFLILRLTQNCIK